MSTVFARQVAASPTRTAGAAWRKICELIAPDPNGTARRDLDAAAGVAASAIASESPSDDPIVVFGAGARVRVYCVFGDDAVTGAGVHEDALSRSPTDGDNWQVSIPFLKDDVDWAGRELKHLSTHVTARAVGDAVADEGEHGSFQGKPLEVDLSEFMKP